MNIAVVYVFPNLKHKLYEPLARRFVQAYVQHPTSINHSLYVIVNGGGEITPRQQDLFSPLAPYFIHHTNAGRDIGAYQFCARKLECDLLVCMGAPTRPCVDGWLDFMVQGVQDNGPGLYGCWAFLLPKPHIRTTLFWISPQILNAYPEEISDRRRYEFEFGANSLTAFAMRSGFQALQVTLSGVFNKPNWHHVERDESICLDQHTDNLGYE